MSLVKSLSDFMGVHKGEKIIICGCGTSLPTILPYKDEFITIGVNDVPNLFNPTYLLIVDSSTRFNLDRQRIINNAKVRGLFTCVKGWTNPHLVHFDLGQKSLANIESSTTIDHFLNSPYVAVNLAYKMGAKHIGVIGVDFTNGHFYNTKDGMHPLATSVYLNKVNTSYHTLLGALATRGVTLHNLSPNSRLAIPKITIEEFKQL